MLNMKAAINQRRSLMTNLLTALLVLALLVPSGFSAAEEISVDVVDGYENTAPEHSTYSVDVTFEQSEVGDEVDFEVGVQVESFPSASDQNPEGNENNRLDKVEISLSEGMELVQTQDQDFNDTTIQYRIFDKDALEIFNKTWIIQYILPVNPGDETVIEAQAENESDRLSLYERIVFLFKAIVTEAENEMTFKAGREPGNNPNDPTGHQFEMESFSIIITEPDDPVDPEDPVDPDDPELDIPEIILTGLPEFVIPEDPDEEPAPEDVETPEEEEENTLLVELEETAVQPNDELAAAVSAQNLSLLWLLLLLIPGLFWFLLARLVLVRVPNEKGELETVARKIARYKEKRWFVDVEEQLNKYLAKHGEVFIDFRGGLIKEAKKAVFSGEKVLGTGEVRFALVNRQQVVSWLEKLQEQTPKVA
jgi:hypothetical protein